MATAMPDHLNCPGDHRNIIDMGLRHRSAVQFFIKLCPLGAYVEEVNPIRSKGRRKNCAWRVRYSRDLKPQFVNIDGEQLALSILNLEHANATIVEKTRSFNPPFIEIVYSCRCKCKNVFQKVSMKRCDRALHFMVKEIANLKLNSKNPRTDFI